MDIIRNNKGLSLFITLSFLALFSVIVVGYIATTATDSKVVKRSIYSQKAFFLAESGIHKALYELRSPDPDGSAGPELGGWDSYDGTAKTAIDWPSGTGSLNGSYKVDDPETDGSGHKIVTATGYFLDPTSNEEVTSVIEVEVKPGSDFFANVIWAGDEADISKPDQITGTVKIGDFPDLDTATFEALRAKAVSQVKPDGKNNLYTAADIAAKKAFPTSYWFDSPTNTVPNVVYVEGNLTVKGNNTIYGFFVVAGNVIADPEAVADGTIAGTSSIVGCIYTQGDFEINGGGNALNVDGGVWCKDDFDQGGNGKLDYNAEYMEAIRSLNLINVSSRPNIVEGSWHENY